MFVFEEEVQWGEAGLHSQDVDRSERKAARGPPLDLVLEGRELSCHVNSQLESVRVVAEHWEKK